MVSKTKYEYVLLFIAVFWALFFSFVLQLKAGFSFIGDDRSYLYAAKLLYLEGQFDNTRPLLIAAIQGLPFLFGGSSAAVITWGLLVNFATWFFTSLLLFKIIAERLNRKKAFWWSVLFLLCIGNLAHAFNFLSESVFIFGIVLAVYFIHKFNQTGRYHYVSIAVAVLLLNALVKPVAIGLLIILLAFFITKMKQVFYTKFAALIVVGLTLLFFQMYALKQKYGDFTLSYISYITYYNYLGAKADCDQKGIPFLPGKNARAERFGLLTSHEMKKVANEDLWFQVKNNTFHLAKAYLFCLYSNSSKGNFIVSECKNEKQTSYFNFFHFLFKAISKLQNILFTCLSVVVAFVMLVGYKQETKWQLILSCFILYIFFISGTSCFQCDRFHIAFFPLLLLLVSNLKMKKPI